jgi:predicted RNA-binding Zn-ribbon protein involved in translation (DUF1610 family)
MVTDVQQYKAVTAISSFPGMSHKYTVIPTTRVLEAYKQNNGIKCMFCGWSQLQGGAVEIESGQASQQITCPACGASWTDVYVLSNAVNIEKGDK